MDYRIRKLIAYLESNLHKLHSIEDMAQKVNLSVSHLQHLFKKETDITITQHLRMKRIKKAHGLLTTSFLSVKEICVEIGMNDVSRFIKDFKTIYGITPTQYRKSLYQKAADNLEQLNARAKQESIPND